MLNRLKNKVNRLMMLGACVAGLLGNTSCRALQPPVSPADMARQTLDSLYSHYSVDGTPLLREHFPFDASFKASYLADENAAQGNPYSYLWPFSGTLSAVKELYVATGDTLYLDILDRTVLPGLQCYSDTLRLPAAYASYINTAAPSDRFYDDNLWIGIDMVELYLTAGRADCLDTARSIWKFIESGTDDRLGGGIYWCEQKKLSKNTCANAPGAVMALRLYQATTDSTYLRSAKAIYDWTREKLRDPADGLYFDNVRLNGRIGRAKYAYNSGQMLQAAALLHKITGDSIYLAHADELAAAAFARFVGGNTVSDSKGEFPLFSPGDVWFTAIMIRGFAEYADLRPHTPYMDVMVRNLIRAWSDMRDPDTGLFNQDWVGVEKKDKKWLLTQAAMVEMYAAAAKYLRKNS